MIIDVDFRINGFATGDYHNKCKSCNGDFIGDKRSTICLACALKENQNQLSALPQLKKEIKKISNIINVSEAGYIVVDFGKLKKMLNRLAEGEV